MQGWGFPLISADIEEDHTDTSPGPISATVSSSTGSGHRNKQLAAKKVGTPCFLGDILLLFFSSIKHPSDYLPELENGHCLPDTTEILK